jgi:hypothetical protein
MYKALVSFSGLVSMAEGEVREISDLSIAKDLLKCGYIEEVKEEKEEKRKVRNGRKSK